jgi:hypothetical protein
MAHQQTLALLAANSSTHQIMWEKIRRRSSRKKMKSFRQQLKLFVQKEQQKKKRSKFRLWKSSSVIDEDIVSNKIIFCDACKNQRMRYGHQQ